MDYQETLPFGRTDITPEYYRDQIDFNSALQVLQKNDIQEPETRLENFIVKVPELISWLDKHGNNYPWRYTVKDWDVYVAEILLQRTHGSSVAKIYPDFIERYSSPEEICKAEEEEIKESIRPLGMYNRKTKTLKDVGRIFKEEFGGEVPSSKEDLKRPWRAGNYVANATLLFARGKSTYLIDSNISAFVEAELDISISGQPHKDEVMKELMEALSPEEPSVCRSFYLSIIDKEA